MDDTISRQTVLNALDEISNEVDDGYGFDYAKWREYFCELPPVKFATDTNVGNKLGTNLAEVGTDCISRQAAIDGLRGYLVGKRCPDDGTLTCRLVENEVINKLPPIQPEPIKCKECIHYEADITGNPWGVCCHKDWVANNIGHTVDEDGWCYRAERR